MEHEQEEQIQNLRSKATELLLTGEYRLSIEAYTQLISLCQSSISKKSNLSNLHKTLCLAFSSRAEALARSAHLAEALKDCDEALKIDSSHFKTLLCKGKILLSLNMYGAASKCFRTASLDPQANDNSDVVNSLLEKCKKLESMSRTGAFDISDWVLCGCKGKAPELAEYIGAIEIRKSDISGRGLFLTKNIESGGLLLATKAVSVERAIAAKDCSEHVQMVLWKNFVEKIADASSRNSRLNHLISKLSTGEDDESLEVTDIGLFRPESEALAHTNLNNKEIDKTKLMSILDVNSIVEDAVSSKVLGVNADYQGIGLWLLPSFINHSCDPNVRRLHIGDFTAVHASRDMKAGEELTFAYFDVLSPLNKRREMANNWGFKCRCARCRFEEGLCSKQEMREIEMQLMNTKGGSIDMGSVVYRLEEAMKRLMVRGRGKGYLRASFWEAYSRVFGSEKLMRKWGRKISSCEAVIDSVVDCVGSDERVVRVFVEGLKRNGCGVGGNRALEMEKVVKMGRGLYGKLMKKQAIRALIEDLDGNQG